MWILFALLSGACYTAQGLITRHILRGNKDAWAFSFYFSAIGAIVSLPFMFYNMKVATSLNGWGLMLLVGLLIVVQNLLNFKSTNTLEASIQGSITKFRLVWVFIFGILLLNEEFSWFKLVGTVLTVLAGIIIMNKFRKPESFIGIIWAFLATIVYAVVIVFYKYLFFSFNTASLTFFIFLIPAIINVLIMPKSLVRIATMWKEHKIPVLWACGFGGLANLAMNQSLAIGEASKALVIIEAFLITTLIGEHIFLKERAHLLTKIAAVALATTGAILIRLS